jgi:hypothetical protein
MPTGADEPSLVEALLRGDPRWSRNRNYELFATEMGKRARRRANFLRSVARDLEQTRQEGGAVTIDRGPFARGRVRVIIHRRDGTRRAYLTDEEVALVARTFPLVGGVFDLHAVV